MAALAHKPAGLVGPFHVASPLCPSGMRQMSKAGVPGITRSGANSVSIGHGLEVAALIGV